MKRGEHWRFRCCEGLSGVTDPFRRHHRQPALHRTDPTHRAYRDGGGLHGGALSLALGRRSGSGGLKAAACFCSTPAAPSCDGEDQLKHAACRYCAVRILTCSYREIDPDVFGEELERDDVCGCGADRGWWGCGGESVRSRTISRNAFDNSDVASVRDLSNSK